MSDSKNLLKKWFDLPLDDQHRFCLLMAMLMGAEEPWRGWAYNYLTGTDLSADTAQETYNKCLKQYKVFKAKLPEQDYLYKYKDIALDVRVSLWKLCCATTAAAADDNVFEKNDHLTNAMDIIGRIGRTSEKIDQVAGILGVAGESGIAPADVGTRDDADRLVALVRPIAAVDPKDVMENLHSAYGGWLSNMFSTIETGKTPGPDIN